MGKGKRAKKKKISIGKIFLSIFLIFIIVVVIIGILKIIDKYINKAEADNTVYNASEYDPIISYYDEKEGRKITINEKEVYNKEFSVLYSKGTASISEDGKNYKTYNDEILTDGTYTIIVKADDGTASRKTFSIDTKPPTIIGIKEDVYNEPPQIQLEDPNDVKIITLTKNNGEIIDLKNELNKKDKKYTVTERGSYKLYAEDYNKNSVTMKFIVIPQ